METFTLSTEFITLGQLIKATGIVFTGGEIKAYLAEYTPLVNGEPDNRRGRKLYPGDVVEFPGGATVTLSPKS
ncbi:MAG: S4 domain-containing protein YaaA [Armatimonadetes bacterium]|nr:S4 domain-containing protein YaaA [Armatimonadota bacterium]